MELSGRGVFLTGGAQGIGRAMTEALLEKGAKVLFCGMNAETGQVAESELQEKYGIDNVSFVQCDVTDASQLKETFEAAVSKFGAVEICCNNAGILAEKNWERMFSVNTIGMIQGSQLAFDHMRRDKGGHGGVIINISSVAGLLPFSFFPVYTAGKHAVVGYTTSRARDPDMPAQGVRWCCICPAGVQTNLLTGVDPELKNTETFRKIIESFMMSMEVMIEAFLKLLQDVDNNGKIMEVTAKGGTYRRRGLVDDDGVSNFTLSDNLLTEHPPVPGPIQ